VSGRNSKSLKKAGISPGQPSAVRGGGDVDYSNRGLYSEIVLRNFRGYESLDLSDLGRINLLFGPNNSGKTTVLESIFTHASGLNFQPFFGNVVLRRQEGLLTGPLDMGDKIKSLFRQSDTIPYQYSITARLAGQGRKQALHAIFRPSAQMSDLDPLIFGQFSGGVLPMRSSSAPASTNPWGLASRGLRVTAAEVPSVFIGEWTCLLSERKQTWDITFPVPIVKTELPFKLGAYHDILAHRQPDADLRVYSHLKRYGLLPEFVSEMQETFHDVKDVDIIPYPDGTQGPVYIRTTDNHVVPLYAFGDGMRRWYYLLGHMLVHQKAVHCIEEIDSTMHPASQTLFCRLLAKYADRFDNQLFLTSHNIEFADAFLAALYGPDGIYAKTDSDSVRVITVHVRDGRAEVWCLRGREAFEKRKSFELEFRG
jgi:hypothetical protein